MNGLSLQQEWAELDRNGFLASHVGGARNIFGVSGEGTDADSGGTAQERGYDGEGIDNHDIGEGESGNGGEDKQQDADKGVEAGGDGEGTNAQNYEDEDEDDTIEVSHI